MALEILLVIGAIAVIILSRMLWRQHYWKRKGVPYLEPNFPFGNMESPLFKRTVHRGILVQSMYNKLKQMGAKHAGLYVFTDPVYFPIDPDMFKNVMQNDFQYFQDRGFYYNEKDDPLSAHLFAISGQKWRKLRTKLTPTFTSGKLKMMFDTLVHCAENMLDSMYKYEDNKDGIDIKDAAARYTTDVIGSCAFGLECNSFKDEDAEFRRYGREIFKSGNKFRNFIHIFAFAKPNLARKLGVKLFSKKVSDFFINVVENTINYREKNSVTRNDMLQLLIDLKDYASSGFENNSDGKALSANEIAAQAFVFFIAGFETSSTTMAFCLYELAINQDLQKKVRYEIRNVLKKHNGKLTYEAIFEMKYMGQVIDETLRKYPPLSTLTRKCVADYQVPKTDVIVEKDTRVYISVLGLHHDPEYFPDPEKFDPERFSDENKSNIRPFTYIPFGEGPRICIGLRFGLMQTKVGLAKLLMNYKISLNPKTITPLIIDCYSFILSAKDGIWLDIEKVI